MLSVIVDRSICYFISQREITSRYSVIKMHSIFLDNVMSTEIYYLSGHN
jgi:hypothetical protein